MTLLESYILATMEFVAWILLILKIVNVHIRYCLSALVIFFLICFLVETFKIWILEYIVIALFYIVFVMFIKIAFKKKLIMAMLISVYATFLMLFWQFICTGILSIFVPNMEFVFTNGIIVMSMFLIASILSYLYLPLFKVTEALEEKNELLLVIIVAVLTFILAMYYVEFSTTTIDYLHDIRNLGIFLLLAMAIYFASKIILELKEKNEALKNTANLKT